MSNRRSLGGTDAPYPDHHLGVAFGRSFAELAVQQQLGILPQGRAGIDRAHPAHLAVIRPSVVLVRRSARRCPARPLRRPASSFLTRKYRIYCIALGVRVPYFTVWDGRVMRQAQLVAEQVLPRDIVSGASAIASACPAQPGKSRRLLWVDDSEVLLSLYKAVFEHLGFEVLPSASPQRILDKLSSAAADVAILDYDMPEMNGGGPASPIKDQYPKLPQNPYNPTASPAPPAAPHLDRVSAQGPPPGHHPSDLG